MAWNETYYMFRDYVPEEMEFPKAVIFQDGDTLDITYSMAFTFKDDATLSRTKRVMTVIP